MRRVLLLILLSVLGACRSPRYVPVPVTRTEVRHTVSRDSVFLRDSVSVTQRSSDANLGLPSDIYHLYLMARQIEPPLKSITLYWGNVHIYENNLARTRELLVGAENIKFDLNV